LELTRGPFLGAEKVNCMAARWPHLAPSEALVSRGGQRAVLRPARVARAQLSVGVRRMRGSSCLRVNAKTKFLKPTGSSYTQFPNTCQVANSDRVRLLQPRTDKMEESK